MPNYSKQTSVIIKDVYPMIEKATSKNESKYQAVMNKFFNSRHELLYAIAPYDAIYFTQKDIDELFKSLELTNDQLVEKMQNIVFWDLPVNPQCAKEPYVIVLMMIIRYYLKKKDNKKAELSAIYLTFSGKFYASLFCGVIFPKAPPSKYKEVMDYVVNNMLTDKFDLRKEGSVFGAVRALCITWIATYGDLLVSGTDDDDDIKMMIQQLRDRLRNFLRNIAVLYYEAYKNKSYLNYETDNLEDGAEFRLTDNDALKAARNTENAMNYLTSNSVSMEICNMCKDQNVGSLEIKNIIELILSDNNNLRDVRRVINIIISDFMRTHKGIDVRDIEFVSYTITAKPNTKDKYMIELKETILRWLDENSPAYRRRKSRKPTAISYYRSIIMYFALVIQRVAK